MGYNSSGLFIFDLTGEQIAYSEYLKNCYEQAYVQVGGLVLPIKGVVPKQRRNEIKSRSWVSRRLTGLRDKKSTTRKNRDGSTTLITEKSYYKDDGTLVREIEEITQEPDIISSLFYDTNPFPSLNELFDAVKVLNRGSHSYSVTHHTPNRFPRESKRTTVSTPPGSQTETTQVDTKSFIRESPNDPASNAIKSIVTNSEVYTTEPKVFADPVILISTTGKKFIQYLESSGSLIDKNETYWDQEMQSTPIPNEPTSPGQTDAGSSSNSTEELIVHPANNTITRKTIQVDLDPDGNKKVTTSIVEEPYIDPIEELRRKISEEGSSTTVRNVDGLSETTIVDTFDADGQKLRTQTTVITRDPTTRTTISTDENLNEQTITTRTQTSSTDSDGVETVQEEEETIMVGETRTVTYSSAIDYDNRVKTVTMNRQSVDEIGDVRNEEKTVKLSMEESYKTVEEILEQYEDDSIEDLVYGYLVTEFVISGDVLENEYVQPILDKNFEHQAAWGMFNLISQQLDLGDRISPAMRKKLHEDQARIFTGTLSSSGTNKYRGGFVLDRIALEVFNEQYIKGCVFAENDGFSVEWIPGTDRIYRWTLRLQIFQSLVENTTVVSSGDWEDLADADINSTGYLYHK